MKYTNESFRNDSSNTVMGFLRGVVGERGCCLLEGVRLLFVGGGEVVVCWRG